jgi:hypothetical protein
MKKLIIIFFAVSIAASTVIVFLRSHDSAREPNPEKYIISRVSAEKVSPRFTPVLIYVFMSGEKQGYVAGSGSLFEDMNGLQIITAAHIFHGRWGNAFYAIRRLRPLESDQLSYGVESLNEGAMNITDFRTKFNDVVICKVSLNLKPIPGFYSQERETEEKRISFTMHELSGCPTLRSLVTGEKVMVVGNSQVLRSGLAYYLIMYSSISGESGTGFLDDSGKLYVLKGRTDRNDLDRETEEMLKLPQDTHLSMVIGAFSR